MSTVSACYLLTNTNDPANLGSYLLENGRPLFNLGLLFAANINGTPDAPVLYLNETMTAAIKSGIVGKLQALGIKVSISILGNHQTASISSLTGSGPQLFAKQVSDLVTTHNLDGVDFDDEWSTGTPNSSSFPTLVSELRKSLPNAILSLYFIGGASETLTYKDINVGTLLNYAWWPYYSQYQAPSVPPMTNEQLGAAAINMDPAGDTYTPEEMAGKFATDTIRDGYGVYLYYNLMNKDMSRYLSAVSVPLYGSKTTYQKMS